MLVNNTPVEVHDGIHVKREDLCCPFPGPSFSKMRGVYAHMKNRPEGVIGVLDTFHSKAGWAVSWSGKALGKQVIDFWPRYKADGDILVPRVQQRHALHLGAQLCDLPAGRSAILYHRAKKHMADNFPGSYVMPNALKLPESVTENAAEAFRTILTDSIPSRGTLVISISSGTVASGVLLGFHQARVLCNYDVKLHMGYSRSKSAVLAYMNKQTGIDFELACRSLELIDEGYEYSAHSKHPSAPFPCNPFYDAKAWGWLMNNPQKQPTTFWNIGD